MTTQRFEKVLFIVIPYESGRYSQPYNPPASLGYLSEYLKQRGIKYDVLDLSLGYSYAKLKEKVRSFQPDLIGASLFTFQYQYAYCFFDRLKTDFPGIKIIAGGPHVSILKEEILTQALSLDYAVIGEGEETLYELCRGTPVPLIKGLAFRDNNKSIYNGPRPFITELDILPFPTYDKFELKKYLEKRIPIISSRGCPHSCVFCSVPKICGQRVRFRTPDHVVSEIKYWLERGIHTFPIMDDNFVLWKARVHAICDRMIQSQFPALNFFCPNGVRADCLDKPLLQKMKQAGFTELSFGVEVGNNRMLKLIKKNETMEQIEKAIRESVELGYHITLFFIIGFPGETFDDFLDCVRLALKYPVFTAKFFNLIPYPGTELYEYLKKNDLFLVQPEEYFNKATHSINVPVFKTREMSIDERMNAFKTGTQTEIQVVRNFLRNKYSKVWLVRSILSLMPLKFILNLYWNNRLFRKIVSKIRYYL
ncbi:MAG: radical SAM protein [bacterium]|nr:radical SAM protein [bacterium]